MCLLIGSEELERDVEFEVIGEAPDKAPPPQPNQEEVNNISNGNKGSSNQQSTSAKGQHSSCYHFIQINLTINHYLYGLIFQSVFMVFENNALMFLDCWFLFSIYFFLFLHQLWQRKTTS